MAKNSWHTYGMKKLRHYQPVYVYRPRHLNCVTPNQLPQQATHAQNRTQ